MVAIAKTIDGSLQKKITGFIFARLSLLTFILLATIFLKQEVLGQAAIVQTYSAICFSFFLSLITISFWENTLRVRYFLPSQLLYDLLLTSYLVYLTGVNDSIFLFLYLFNIVLSAIIYQLHGALFVSTISGLIYAFIYFANVEGDNYLSLYNLAHSELLFLLTALLCGQLMDEVKRQKSMLDSQRENIAKLELFNQNLLNNVPVGIVVVDPVDYVLAVNTAALSLVEIPHLPDFKIKYQELLPDLKGITRFWSELSEIQKIRFLFYPGKSKSKKCSLQVVDFSDPNTGKHYGHILVIQDKTKIVDLEKKLERESKLSATGQLAAGIAHEIRNPLASISGSIELLSQTMAAPNSDDKRLVEISLKEIRRLNRLVKDFLEFAKPHPQEKAHIRLLEVVTEVVDAIRNQIHGKQKVTFFVEIDRNFELFADREKLKQVFFNLILNAIEANQERAITVSILASKHLSETIVDVLDDGSGIPEDISGKIFEPFFTTKDSGTGLGLPTVAQILKAVEGEINLEQSTSGAHFRMKFAREPEVKTGT